MSKEMDQKLSETSRHKAKRRLTDRESSEALKQIPPENIISARPTVDRGAQSNVMPDAGITPGLQPEQADAKNIVALQAWLDDARRQNAALERRVDARSAELGLAEKRIATLEERERQALEQGEQLKASLAVAQSDVRALFDRMGQRLSDFSRNANMREAMVRDELAAERLQDQQDKVAAVLRTEQAIVRQHLCAQAVRLAASRPAEAAAALALVKFDGEAVADTALSASDDPIKFLAARGPGAMTLGVDASFEIDVAMRWTDTEFVAAAYRWLVDREADHDIVASLTNKVRRGRLRQDILVDIAQSAEALIRLDGGALVQIEDDRMFVQEAYRQLLGRAADAEGLGHYADRLATGATRITIVMDMSASQEARRASRPLAAALRGIAMVGDQGYRLRQALRRWTPRFSQAKRSASYAARIAAVECLAARRNRDAIAQLDAIRDIVADRVNAAYRLGSKRALASISLVGTASTAVGLSSGSIGQDMAKAPSSIFSRLPRRGASLTPAQIIQAIRSEIQELELN